MSLLTPFDILSVPLRGTHLIEAGAGTGKTFTITNLVLRLVAEEQIDIGRILAVTFTESATRELRDRIRSILSQARFLIDSPDAKDYSVAAAVVRQAVERKGGRLVERALQKALLSFDEAGIFTIHGFCNRILNQFAFESSLRFDTELITDQSRFVRETVDDFWRRNFSRAPRLLCAVALKRRLLPDDLVKFARTLIDKPTLRLVPDASDDAREQLVDAFDAVRSEWRQSHDVIKKMVYEDDRLSRARDAYHKDTLNEYTENLERVFGGDIDPAGLAVIDRFTPKSLAEGVKLSKKEQGVPEHPFFNLCREYAAAETSFAVYCRHEFRRFLECELQQRKKDSNVQYFSDLLTGLQKALASDHRGLLAAAIREKYQAALIDEFQDTDPVQYDIFTRLFGSEAHRLFLIGDPKQSIFAFRSADVFSYIRSATGIAPERKHALPRNWRSETTLVGAVNHLFRQAENPFVLGQTIGFNEVTADENNTGNRSPLKIDGRGAGNIELWFIRKDGADNADRALSREEARNVVMGAVADEISSLLNRAAGGAVQIGERPLSPADIAVLITRNVDAGRMKERLAALNIPAVISRTGGVFSTTDAAAVERVLLAMAAPADITRVNAALADDLIGCSATDIQGFLEDDARHDEYEGHLRRFAEYHQYWRSGGFIRVFRRFLADYHVRVRLLGFPDGERRLTNVLHLSELIHQADVRNRLGMNGLLDWIAERRGAEEEAPDEEQLRLERDDEAVQIVTVWKSKGLQYPVVFCPFMWSKGAAIRDGDVVFHDRHDLTLDIGDGDEAHVRAARREKLSELVRLLYVAVTRAINRCYLVYGKIGDPGRAGATALDYVLTGGLPDGAVSLDGLGAEIKGLTAEDLYRRVAERLGTAPDLIHLKLHERRPGRPYVPPAVPEKGELKPRMFSGDRVDQEWGIASFTHLASRGRSALLSRDEGGIKRDEFSEKKAGEGRSPAATIFDFPSGPTPGLCVHSIFEHLDFSLSRPDDVRRLIDDSLRQYGLDRPSPTGAFWNDVIYQMVTDVLRTPVLPHDDKFTLGELSGESKTAEMEFYYPIRGLTADKFRALMGRRAGDGDARPQDFSDSSGRLEFRPLHGYMRGFMDLVFEHDGKYYLLDWKTNHLGYEYRDYAFSALCRCVAEEFYYLQYYIYTVALHRYLSHRLRDYDYDAHFGGIVTAFILTVRPEI